MSTTRVIALVGDSPSLANTAQCIPFVGTQSYKRLSQWCKQLCYKPILLNSNTEYWLQFARKLHMQHVPVVALGRLAERRLKQAGVPCLYMPHPSGLNRNLNDHYYLQQKLLEMGRYCRQEH